MRERFFTDFRFKDVGRRTQDVGRQEVGLESNG